eukprot:278086_1
MQPEEVHKTTINVHIPNEQLTIDLEFDFDETLEAIKSALFNELDLDQNEADYFLYHMPSGLIFGDNSIRINECMTQLNLDTTDTLSFHLAQMFVKKKEKQKEVRSQNEAHVQKRRESRVMIVKSKISSEIQRGSRRMIEYIEDSPFFWSQVKESENRIRRLCLRLNRLVDMILDLCSVTITFSEHCNRIHNLVKKSWQDVENQYSADILSLNAQFNELGEQFLHMSNASKQLAVTMKAVLVDAFRDFSQTHLSQVSASSKALQGLEKGYEAALRKLLHSPKNLPPKNLNTRDNFNNKRITDLQQYEEWRKKTVQMRKHYELKRYDHVNVLNRVINRHRYELILNLCACFSAFETFFHVGYEASLAHKVFHRSIQMGVAQKTLNEDKSDRKLLKNRKEIEKILEDGKDYFKKENEKKEQKEKEKEQNPEDSEEEDEDDAYAVDYYSGYLWKQSSNMKKDWKRRWFVLEHGELAYYRSRDKLDREFVVNAMLCKVKQQLDHDYRWVFELISPSRRVYVLQAQSEQDYTAWCCVLQNQVHRLLRKSTAHVMSPDSTKKEMDANNSRQRKREIKRAICELNKQCADCGKKEPEWVSINTGVVICIGCCGIHRGLGTHISKVRSLILDDINESTLKSVLELGNENVNRLLEDTIPSDYSKINQSSSPAEKEKFIKGKYMFKMFINVAKQKESGDDHQQINNKLFAAADNNQLLLIFEALCFGANLDCRFEQHSHRTALHQTAVNNYSEATEFLLQNGATQQMEDDDGKLPRDLARENKCKEVMQILEYHGMSDYNNGVK